MLRVGIVGSGFGLYGLLPAFNSIENCKVVAICGKKTDRLVYYCESIGLKNIYTDWRSMLQDQELDAVALAVTPGAQYEIAKFAIEKGLHIFAEKPLALNSVQAQELATLAKTKKIVSALDFIFPEIAEWQEVKKLLDRQVLGELKNLTANWNFLSYNFINKLTSWKTNESEGGGAVAFYFSHSFYYLEYFAGRISRLSGSLLYDNINERKVEAGVDLVFDFENGVRGQAHLVSNSSDLPSHKLVFQCEKGMIILENTDSSVTSFKISIVTQQGTKKSIVAKKDLNKLGEDERVKYVRKIAQRFINSCEKNTEMNPSFVDGLRVQELIELARSKRSEE